MRRRGLAPLVAALALVACSPNPTVTPTASSGATAPPAPSTGATLTVSGAGLLCYQWYAGCAPYFGVVDPGWALPGDWQPSSDVITFDVALVANSEAVEVTGIRPGGRDRIEAGAHRLVVINTTSPDSGPSVGTITASILCSLAVEIPPGARAVRVHVAFDATHAACSLRMTTDIPTAPPSS